MLSCLIAAAVFSLGALAEAPEQPDLVVYGATAAGTIAAIAAADAGLHVVLLASGQHVGGMVASGLGRTDYGNKAVIGGMSREFFKRVGKHYGEKISWFFEPHVAEQVYRDWLKEAGVTVLFGKRVTGLSWTKPDAHKTKWIGSIEVNGDERYSAPYFIDASYEGDLLPLAHVSYTVGREGRDVYGESLAGRIAYSPKHQFTVPVSPYDAQGKLLPLVYGGDPGKPGEGDKKVQAYNFRLCMTQNKDNMVPWPKPEGYDPAQFELLKRYLAAKPGLQLKDLCHPSLLKNGKTDTNNNGAISTDYIGGSWAYPEADYATRKKIWEKHKRYTQGFFYFLAHDPSVPPKLQAEVNSWGLAKDEFTDTDHWPHQLYIREARRMIGEYVMRQQDLQTQRTKPDSIGMGSYNSDSHNVQRIPVKNDPHFPGAAAAVLNEGDMQVPVRPYEIAYRALAPKWEQCGNLLVVCCVSASHVAYSSIRMEPQYMIMGHAAGDAIAQAFHGHSAVQDVNVSRLQKTLRAQHQIIALEDADAGYINPRSLPGIVEDADQADRTGTWHRSTTVTPFVGLDYLHSEKASGTNATVRFNPELPAAGHYEIRFAYSPYPNRATNVAITIKTLKGLETVHVNERKAPGPHAPFKSLGVFALDMGKVSYVEVSAKGADGYVVVDAMQWIPVD